MINTRIKRLSLHLDIKKYKNEKAATAPRYYKYEKEKAATAPRYYKYKHEKAVTTP